MISKDCDYLLYVDKEFVCPHCGKSYPIKDAVVVDEVTDTKFTGTTFKGRYAIHHYVDTHHNVRFCPACAKRRERVRNWTLVFSFAILPIVSFLYILIKGWDNDELWLFNILSPLLGAFLITVIGGGFLSWLIHAIYLDVNAKEAAKGDALAPYDIF